MSGRGNQENGAAFTWGGAALSLVVGLFLVFVALPAHLSTPDEMAQTSVMDAGEVEAANETAVPAPPARHAPASAARPVRFVGNVPSGAEVSLEIQSVARAGSVRCSYVALPRDAEARADPPLVVWSDLASRDITWQPTPAPQRILASAAGTCASFWPERMRRALIRALQSDGSWYGARPGNAMILIYSLPQNVTIRVERLPSP